MTLDVKFSAESDLPVEFGASDVGMSPTLGQLIVGPAGPKGDPGPAGPKGDTGAER